MLIGMNTNSVGFDGKYRYMILSPRDTQGQVGSTIPISDVTLNYLIGRRVNSAFRISVFGCTTFFVTKTIKKVIQIVQVLE